MNYEQKYKKVLSFLKDLKPHMSDYCKEKLDGFFPELRESEDERIRKEIISFITNTRSWFPKEETKSSWIAWLEKQGEQKPIDKSEPKFKAGDWVVAADDNGNMVIERVVEFLGNKVRLVDTDGIYTLCPQSWLNHYRLWTIQDAKDGDVVVDKSDGTIGIFQSIGHHPDGGSYNDPSYCFLHCRYDDGYFYADFENGNTMCSDDAIPATKEQRDILFQKMKEAGYEWDAEKKELNKIEKESTWSEEDEYQINTILHGLDLKRKLYKKEGNKVEEERYSTQYNWLKSLKPNHRKPSEEQMSMLLAVLNDSNNITSESVHIALKSLYQDLLKL